MRAVVYDGPKLPLSLRQWPDPAPASNEIVIKVCRCGICGTDLQMTSGEGACFENHTVLGHEFSGEIVALGVYVKGFAIGDRVVSMAYDGCGHCDWCRRGWPLWCTHMRGLSGGFAEFTLSSAAACIKIPDALALNHAALIEPLTCAYHAVDLAGDVRNRDILVLGTGTMGLGAIYWSRLRGARSITASSRSQASAARALAVGADRFVRTADLAADGKLYPLVIECSGARGLIDVAMQHALPLGQVIATGLCAGFDQITPLLGLGKEISLRFSMSYSRSEFDATAAQLARARSDVISAFIGDEIGLEELPSRFEQLRRSDSARGKILVAPNFD